MQIKKTAIVTVFVSAIFVSANFMVAKAYEPLVRIPGLPADGPINLSQYIVGLYNFLLSIVGIVAVMMLIIGGIKYIAAAGNASVISDAKDTIWNAIFGLLLALLSWVIVSTINPDVLYIKHPASSIIGNEYEYDLGVCGRYDGALCTCNDTTTPFAVDQASCETACADACGTTEGTPCIRYGENEPSDGMCYCVNGEDIPLVIGLNCNNTCKLNNCLVADIKIGVASISTADNAVVSIEQARRTAVPDDYSKFTEPFYVEENTTFSLVLESALGSVSPYDITVYNWDMAPPFIKNATGVPDLIGSGHDFFVVSGDLNYPPNSGLIGMWSAIDANPGKCKKNPILNTWHDEAWVCPISLKITDGAGVGPDSNIDVAYVGFEKP